MKKRFALFLSMLIAASLCVTPLAAGAEVEAGYDSGDFYGQPSVVLRLDSADALSTVKDGESPASVWMEINAELKVIGASDEELGDFSELLDQSTESGALAVVYPQDAAAYTAFSEYVKEESLTDMAVASSDISVLMQATDDSFRVIYIASEMNSQSKLIEEIGKANAVGAQTLVVEHRWADATTVRAIQARFKAVWIMTDGTSVQIADAIGRGAYGILTPDCAAVYALYQKISSSVESGEGTSAILSRAPYVAAHRGDWGLTYTENTMGAIRSAAQNGATHAEIDIRLTADNQVVIFHNDNITYNGTSQPIKNLTLDQLQSIVLSDGVSTIPTLDEVLEALSGGELGDMLLIIEFKGQEAELATLFTQKVQQYGVSDKIVVISFYPAQIMLVSQMLPSVPTSLLLYTTGGQSALTQASAVKSGIDMQRDNLRLYYGDGSVSTMYADYFRILADRGYSTWLWTYDTASMSEAVRYGVTGITTNDCWYTINFLEELNTQDVMEVETMPQEGSTLNISARTYKGEDVTVPARVIYLEQDEKESEALLIAQPEKGIGLISESVTLRVKEDSENPGGETGDNTSDNEGKGGCNSAMFASAGAMAAVLCGAAVLFLRKKA